VRAAFRSGSGESFSDPAIRAAFFRASLIASDLLGQNCLATSSPTTARLKLQLDESWGQHQVRSCSGLEKNSKLHSKSQFVL
jgi:hypothetical protein